MRRLFSCSFPFIMYVITVLTTGNSHKYLNFIKTRSATSETILWSSNTNAFAASEIVLRGCMAST